ncbi:MAG TPA: serine hydrolase domain-containing protein [Steroidobacteraceae bacterium]|nr:serine hydrolase domain-containing protein [Steroidobacteraceae bacterium]
MLTPSVTLIRIGGLAALLAIGATPGRASGQESAALMPVSRAKDGLPAELGYRLREGFTSANAYATGDPNLYYFMHWEEFVPHGIVRRGGPVRALVSAPSKALGQVRAKSSLGEMALDELIADPRSRIQGFIVVHKGRIVYEQYPGMREDDHHLWFSSSKSVAGLLVGLLEADGKIDVSRPIDAYLPELAGTDWQGVSVLDILDMSSGLDLAESEQSRNDPVSPVNHFFRIELGDTSGLGTRTSDQILFAVRKKSPPGEAFEYSSLNTKMLGLLVERVSGARLADFLSERVWSRMGAEGDAQVGVNLQGGAAIYGMISSRLRDKARYGMLYTPSWKKVSAQRVVPQSLLDRIRDGCRPTIYEHRPAARRALDSGAEQPRCNSRQWDAVFADGDLFKGGARGQGIYVSPARDLVVAWFSTTPESGWLAYARAVARALDSNP